MTTDSIAPPADARRVFPAPPDPATVTMTARQFDDGTVLRGVTLQLGNDELLDADEARSLAVVLLEAADELKQLSHPAETRSLWTGNERSEH